MSTLRKRSRALVITVTTMAVFFTMGLFTGEVDAATYKISKKKASVYVGSKVKLKVVTKKGKATTKKIKWKSSNKKIATVSKYGNVKGKKAGKVKITAKVGKKTFKSTVTVKKAKQRINTKKASVMAGQTVSLKMLSLQKEKVKGKYKTPKVTWSSANTKIASVSSKGTVTTKKPGKVKITAKVGTKKTKYTSTITVGYPNYTINTATTPIKSEYKTYAGYTSKSRQYYTIRSFLEVFEASGGGTLTLAPGTYSITNTLYVPSNVNIYLSDGVIIKKSSSTGTSKLTASKSLFQLCAPSKAKVANGYAKGKYKSGYTGYNGVSNVNFISYGNAVIDNASIKDSISLIMGHNNYINISNITFQNMNYGHFIEANSSANVNVNNCTFKDGVGGSSNNKEAINIDTPDLTTNGFNSPWSSFDKTPVTNFTVNNCSFSDIPVSVGSHRYSEGKQHTNIRILNSTIKNMSNNGIYALNWKDCTISGNTIDGIDKSSDSHRGIRVGGSVNLTIKNNTFRNMPRIAQFYAISLNGYNPIYCDILEDTAYTDEYMRDLLNNNTLGENIDEDFVRVNPFMLEDNSDSDWNRHIRYFFDGSKKYIRYTPEGGGNPVTPAGIKQPVQNEEVSTPSPVTPTEEITIPTSEGITSPEAFQDAM